MALRSGSCRITLTASRPRLCKNAAVSSALPAFLSDSKTNKLAGQQRGTPAPSHRSFPISALTPASAQFFQALKYIEAHLLRILKIFLEIKGQTQLEVFRKRPLKAKLLDIYSEKLNMDCFYCCQQCKDHFVIAGATGLNCTPFAVLSLCGKINFR